MFEGTFIKCASIGYVISKWPKELVNGCKILRSFHQLRPEVFSRMMVAPRVITYLQKFIPYDMMVQCCMHSAVCVRFFFFYPYWHILNGFESGLFAIPRLQYARQSRMVLPGKLHLHSFVSRSTTDLWSR